MNCPNCGAKITPEDRFCGECGTPLNQNPKPSEETHHNVTKRESEPIEHQEEIKKYVQSSESHDPAKAQQNESLTRTNRTEQTHSQQQAPLNQQQPEHRAEPQYASIDREKLNKHAQEIKNEGMTFFKSLFTAHDSVVARKHPFNLKTILTITVAYAILTLLTIALLFSSLLGGSAVFKVWFSLLIFIAVNLIVTFVITRLIIKDPIPFIKVLSDFVFINTYAWLFFILGLFMLLMGSISVPLFMLAVAVSAYLYSTVYLITMYANRNLIRIPVFYGILIYIIIEFIIFRVSGEMLITQLLQAIPPQIKSLLNILTGSSSGGFNGGGF